MVFASQKELFPQVGGIEWYKTIGFKEIALIYGTVEMSYKKAHILINRIRYQDENITPCRTLHDNTEKEGAAVLACVNQKSAAILKENNFTLQGVPQDETEVYGEDGAFQEEADVKEAIESLNNQAADYLSNPIPYELPECTVNITVDDVLVKKQNEIRDPKEKPKEGEKKKRKSVYNTITHIEHNNKKYIINSVNTVSSIPLIIGKYSVAPYL